MKFYQAAAVAIAALSAATTASPNPPVRRDGQCPSGYALKTYYATVSATPSLSSSPSPSPSPSPSSASSSSSPQPTTTIRTTSTSTTQVTLDVSSTSQLSGVGAVSTTAAVPAPVSSLSETPTVAVSIQQRQPEPSTTTTTTAETTAAPVTTTSKVPVEVVSSSSEVASSSSTSAASTQPTSATSSLTSSLTSLVALGSSNSGQATFYGGDVGAGTCSFTSYTLPAGIFGTALSDSNWDDAANCGACVAVTGPSGNYIKAMIVDECPGCGENHLDLFENAFAELAATSVGVIDVNWTIVECGIDSPIVLRNKDGTSQYWFSMQVVNSNVPVKSLEVSTDGGNTWQATTRAYYNYFENSSGFGTDTVDVRVTSIMGKSIVVNNVSCSSGSSTTASENF